MIACLVTSYVVSYGGLGDSVKKKYGGLGVIQRLRWFLNNIHIQYLDNLPIIDEE